MHPLLCSDLKLEMAEELLKEMIAYGVKPDDVVFGVLINAFADVGSNKEAMGYVGAMRNAGFPGNPIIYNSLIKTVHQSRILARYTRK